MSTNTQRPKTGIQQPPHPTSKQIANNVGFYCIMLSIGIGIITMILTSILISKDVGEKYKFSLIMALVGSLCPITCILLLILMELFAPPGLTDFQGNVVILVFIAAAICLQITFLVIKPQKVESHKGLSMTIQVFVYLGIIVDILVFISVLHC